MNQSQRFSNALTQPFKYKFSEISNLLFKLRTISIRQWHHMYYSFPMDAKWWFSDNLLFFPLFSLPYYGIEYKVFYLHFLSRTISDDQSIYDLPEDTPQKISFILFFFFFFRRLINEVAIRFFFRIRPQKLLHMY